jgi:cyclase
MRDAGDQVELAKIYSDEGADELVFLDISAMENAETLVNLVREVALQLILHLLLVVEFRL